MATVRYHGRDVPVEIANQIHLAKCRLKTLSKDHEVLVYELERLHRWTYKLITDTPVTAPHHPDEYFLQMMSVHILIVALLEFSLKCVGKPKKELLDCLRRSPVLDELEADWLIHTVLIRHTLVHNFGRLDSHLLNQEKKHIKKLKIHWGKGDSVLTTHVLEVSVLCLRLLEKFVFLDVLSKELTDAERQAFTEYFATG